VVDGDELGVSETSAHAGDQAWTWFRSHKRATQMAELLGAETFPGSFGGVVATRDEAELAALGVVARFRALVDEYLRA
jgi:hypothetical protein